MTLKEDFENQKKMLEGKSGKEKLVWFWGYYKIPVIIFAGMIVLLVMLIRTWVTNKPQAAGLIMLNAESEQAYQDPSEWLEQPLADYMGVNLKTNSLMLSTGGHITPGGSTDQYEIAEAQKVMVYVAAQQVDVLCADAWNYESYAIADMYMDLRDVLNEKQIAKYEPYFYYVDGAVIEARQNYTADGSSDKPFVSGTIADITDQTKAAAAEQRGTWKRPDPKSMKDPVPVGIIMTDSPYLTKSGLYQNAVPIVGVIGNSKHLPEARYMVDFLWEHE